MTHSKNSTNPKKIENHDGELNQWAEVSKTNIQNNTRSNWEAVMYHEVLNALFKMSRLPEDHDLYLSKVASKRAADVLAAIQANTLLEPPRLMNEDGDTVLFSWQENDIKKYLCVDEENIELEFRKLGTRHYCSEQILTRGLIEVEKLLEAVGQIEKNSSEVQYATQRHLRQIN